MIFSFWRFFTHREEIIHRLTTLERKVDTMDERVQQVLDSANAAAAASEAAVTKLGELKAQVAALAEQVASAIPITAEDLAAIDAAVDGITAELGAATA